MGGGGGGGGGGGSGAATPTAAANAAPIYAAVGVRANAVSQVDDNATFVFIRALQH